MSTLARTAHAYSVLREDLCASRIGAGHLWESEHSSEWWVLFHFVDSENPSR